MWKDVWERKGAAVVERYDLGTLLALDGFDAGAGKLRADHMLSIAALVTRELDLRPGMRLLEVGCGAGALLSCLRCVGAELFGVDYASSQIEHARRAVPEAKFAVSEARALPFEVDVVVCHSVFHYFPDLDYARDVLAELRRVAPTSLILDVPDAALKDVAESARHAGGSKPGDHLYYPRSFFEGRVWSNELPDYGNAPYRFHAKLSP